MTTQIAGSTERGYGWRKLDALAADAPRLPPAGTLAVSRALETRHHASGARAIAKHTKENEK
jgi:hypothetical protein